MSFDKSDTHKKNQKQECGMLSGLGNITVIKLNWKIISILQRKRNI